MHRAHAGSESSCSDRGHDWIEGRCDVCGVRLAETPCDHDWAHYGCGLASPDRVEQCGYCGAIRTIPGGMMLARALHSAATAAATYRDGSALHPVIGSDGRACVRYVREGKAELRIDGERCFSIDTMDANRAEASIALGAWCIEGALRREVQS